MHRFIDTADDVIAVTIADRITGADLSALMDRLEARMTRHDRVHVFVESRSLEAIDVTQLPSYAARAMPLFGKLRQFDRVAVVADQAWVRAATRLESAMLPFVQYRTFEPAQREEALAWVMGGVAGSSSQ